MKLRSFKYISIVLLILLVITGCAKKSTNTTKEKFKVVTTFTVIQDIAANVAGDAATVVSITKPGAEIHGYEPTPGDIEKAQDADLIIWNGLNLERWFEKFFEKMDNIPAITATEGIKPASIYEGPYSGLPNPHAWMSPSNALIYVENIRKALVKYDSANADIYNENAKKYSEKIKLISVKNLEKANKIPPEQRYLVSSEGAFTYLAIDLGFKEAYLWPINADQMGTPKQISKVINIVRENNIPVVFSESTISPKPAKQVASETNAKYGGVLYVDSLSGPDGKVPTYIALIEMTINTIMKGFGLEVE